MLARRRAVRTERLAGLLNGLSTDELDALAAALPSLDALANVQRAERSQQAPEHADRSSS